MGEVTYCGKQVRSLKNCSFEPFIAEELTLTILRLIDSVANKHDAIAGV